jgi:protein phosphatase
MKVRAAGLSDVGRCRERNQDQYVADPELGLYAVADGMGGHAAGEVASRLAIDALTAVMQAARDGGTPADAARRLRAALAEGNRRICESATGRAEWRGMGTTLVALVVLADRVVIGHVGDSRCYLLRGSRLERLTSDHSWVNEQVERGLLSADEAHRHPMRNIVTRALGNQPSVEVDLTESIVRAGDVFLLCSDGLNSMLLDSEIEATLRRHAAEPQRACRALVDAANGRGGEDNITVVVVAADRG